MTIGRHLIADLCGCDRTLLQNEIKLIDIFTNALQSSDVNILAYSSYKFPGEGGVTGIFLLSESHSSFHSYPEFGYVAVDIFTCGVTDPVRIMAALRSDLSASSEDCQILLRGGIISNNITHIPLRLKVSSV